MKNLHNITCKHLRIGVYSTLAKLNVILRKRDDSFKMDAMDDEILATVMLRLPSTLSAYSGGKSQLLLRAGTVEQLLSQLENQHRQVWEHLCTEHGHVRNHIQIFVNNELISGDDGLKTLLKPGQEVIVLPSAIDA
jgi:molybdopterin synthase sulfur carrier subunit